MIFFDELNLVDLLGVLPGVIPGVQLEVDFTGLSKLIRLSLGTAKLFRGGPRSEVSGLSDNFAGFTESYKLKITIISPPNGYFTYHSL